VGLKTQKRSRGTGEEETQVGRSPGQASSAAKVGCPGQQNFVCQCAGAGQGWGAGEGKGRILRQGAEGGGVAGREEGGWWIKISRRLGAQG
jgi:hypothetical protein